MENTDQCGPSASGVPASPGSLGGDRRPAAAGGECIAIRNSRGPLAECRLPGALTPERKKGGTTSYFTNWRAWMKRPQLRPRRRALKVESSAVHTAPLWTRGHTGWSPSTSRPFQWEMRHTRTIEGPTLSQRPRPFPRCTPQMRTVWSSLADAII